ncbi:hypothetical protein BDQ17DRAFT_1433307 [Cyathus striatus]|nr:hypothetical protein BDQ17DRAFT_1433307 [Cyathus striatus]
MACGEAEETGNGLEEGRYHAVLVVDEGRKHRLEKTLDTWKKRLDEELGCLEEKYKARKEHREESTNGGNQQAAAHTESDSDEEDYKITTVDETIACYVYFGILHGPVVLKKIV